MKKPMWRPCSTGSPQKTGSCALGGDVVRDRQRRFAGFCSGPPSPIEYVPTQNAIQLSMIVEITSCAPTVGLQEAGDPGPDRAGERRGDDRRAGRAAAAAIDAHEEPIQFATIEADEVLALAADVEHAAAERERDGEAGEDERASSGSSVCWRL